MAGKSVHPVANLREHATALEAAMSVAIAAPRRGAVHQMRTLVRRLEAQMSLLQELEALPADSSQAQELRRRLAKLRRAAGQVRDLDVLRKALKTEPGLPKRAAEELRDELKDARIQKAKKLQRVLLKQLPRVAGALEQVVQSLSTANGLMLPELRLVPLVKRWTEAQEDSAPADLMDDEQLHNRRKLAKSARYMMENAKFTGATARAAARYEEEQELGGQWHDWMELEETSRVYFGKKHSLTVAARLRCQAARAEYVQLLSDGS